MRSLREGTGLTIDQVAEKLGLSASTISRIETARVGVRSLEMRALLELYEVTEAQRAELIELARTGRQQPWWHQYRDLPSVPVPAFEADAASISQYSALLVPGLLQTREYASEVIRAILPDAEATEVARRLTLRMKRQELLTREAPDLWVVLDEAALHRSVGGAGVMHDQLQRLIDATALANVTLQVLPYSAGPHAGMDGEFTIFGYRDPADPELVFIENTGGDLYLDSEDKTRRYRLIFHHLQVAALNPPESIRALATVQHELKQKERG